MPRSSQWHLLPHWIPHQLLKYCLEVLRVELYFTSRVQDFKITLQKTQSWSVSIRASYPKKDSKRKPWSAWRLHFCLKFMHLTFLLWLRAISKKSLHPKHSLTTPVLLQKYKIFTLHIPLPVKPWALLEGMLLQIWEMESSLEKLMGSILVMNFAPEQESISQPLMET